MQRLVYIFGPIVGALLAATAFAQLSTMDVGSFGGAGGGATPNVGDVSGLSGAVAYGGTRRYNAAYGTGAALDLCDTAVGTTCGTVNFLSNGDLDKAGALALAACASACSVSKIYDSTGSGHPPLQTVAASRPTFISGAAFIDQQNNHPCIIFSGSQFVNDTTLTTANGNFTIGAVVKQTTATALQAFGGGTPGGNDVRMEIRTGPALNIFNGNSLVAQSFAGTGTIYNRLIGVYSTTATSSIAYAENTGSTPGSSGVNAFSAGWTFGQDTNGDKLTGNICEMGVWPSTMSPTNVGNMDTNMKAYYAL